MGTPIVNLDTLIDTRVSANIDVQTTIDARQDALDAVVDAQAVLDSVEGRVSAKKVELNQHTTVKKTELDTYADSLESGLDVYGDGKVDEYDANALNRITQYNDNHTDKLTIYNSNDAIKMSQYNANHIDRLEDINYAYADRIVQMLKTKRIMGMVDEYVAQTEEHMIPFLSTDDDNYIYYGNGVLLVEGVDYTIYDTTTIELVVKANPYDVITQINTQVLNDMLTAEGALFEERIGAANGVAGLDGNGLLPSAQLPSYVDDVLEVANYTSLPTVGETGKIYLVIADDTSGGDTSSYRWTGSVYAMVSNTLTAADVKSLYESNVNTNAYDDAAVAKLAGIEAEATADQTGAEIKALYESNADTNEFTDGEKIKLADTEITSQLNDRDTANRNTDNHVDGAVNATYTLAERILVSTIEDKATIANPVFTGIPEADTATIGTSTTQLATTAFVVNEINKIEEW